MSIKRTVVGNIVVALGVIVAGAGIHANSEAPSVSGQRTGHDLFGSLGTAGSLGAGAGLCYVGYRLLVAPASTRALERTGSLRRRQDGTTEEDTGA